MSGKPVAKREKGGSASYDPVPVRERLRADLDEAYERILSVLNDALESKKKVRVFRQCERCGCKHAHMVEVVNVEAALKAAEFFANQSLGRPGEQRQTESVGVTIVRRVVE